MSLENNQSTSVCQIWVSRELPAYLNNLTHLSFCLSFVRILYCRWFQIALFFPEKSFFAPGLFSGRCYYGLVLITPNLNRPSLQQRYFIYIDSPTIFYLRHHFSRDTERIMYKIPLMTYSEHTSQTRQPIYPIVESLEMIGFHASRDVFSSIIG